MVSIYCFLFGCRGGIFHCPPQSHSRCTSVAGSLLQLLAWWGIASRKRRAVAFSLAHPRPPSEAVVSIQNPTLKDKTKAHRMVCFCFMVAGVGFEPHGLRVMSPTSYQAALPRDMKFGTPIHGWCRRPGSNRYETLVSRDFKSRASACSATPAKLPVKSI